MEKRVRQVGYHTTGPGKRGFAIFEDGSTQFDNEPNKQYALEAEVETLKAQNAALVKASNELLSALYASRSRFNGVVNEMFEATPRLIEAMRALVDIAKDTTP